MHEQSAAYRTMLSGHWCPVRDASSHLPHCWHIIDASRTGQTPLWCVLAEQCCWCGARRQRTLGGPELGSHGPQVLGLAAPAPE